MTYTQEDLIFDITRSNKEQYDDLYEDYLQLQQKLNDESALSEHRRRTLTRTTADYHVLEESHDELKDKYAQLTESLHPFKRNLFSTWLWGSIFGATVATIIVGYITHIA